MGKLVWYRDPPLRITPPGESRPINVDDIPVLEGVVVEGPCRDELEMGDTYFVCGLRLEDGHTEHEERGVEEVYNQATRQYDEKIDYVIKWKVRRE